jgi:SAM-dependent methyltransferase
MRRWLRHALPYTLVRMVRGLVYFGTAYRCYVCGARLRRLLSQGYGYPVVEQLQVVGGMRKSCDRCPVCHASDRDRLLKFYLEHRLWHGRESEVPVRILHVAPEKGLSHYIMSRQNVRYHAGDLAPERYYHLNGVQSLDLTALPMEDGAYDLVIANHVLEHVPDDARAMAEIRRVLAPGGSALLQVPFSMKLTDTVEANGDESEAERIVRFGQADHVRLYAKADYKQRLARAGLAVDEFWAFDFDPEAAALLRLNPFEPVFVCTRAGDETTADASSATP